MTPLDVLRSNTEAEIAREIIRLVPHWYEAECGPEEYSISIAQHTACFYNHGKLSANLSELLATIRARTEQLPLDRVLEYAGAIDVLVESFAAEWLRMQSREVDWIKLIKYLETVSRRTSENLPVALTLIVRPGAGIGDITQPHLQKFFDRLAASPSTFTYLAVDVDLRLMNYGSVEWSHINNATSCKFYPEFLHPIHSVMDETDLVAHLTPHGDIVIMDKAGILATKRKKKWKLYDVRQFRSGLAYCLGSREVGGEPHRSRLRPQLQAAGGALIYDPQHRILERILNPASILSPANMPLPTAKLNGHAVPHRPCGQVLIGSSIEDIAIGKRTGSIKKKRQLVEMACIDGADCLRRHASPGGRGLDSLASRRRKPVGRPHHRRAIGLSLGCSPHCREFRRRRHAPFPEPQRRPGVRCRDELPVTIPSPLGEGQGDGRSLDSKCSEAATFH